MAYPWPIYPNGNSEKLKRYSKPSMETFIADLVPEAEACHQQDFRKMFVFFNEFRKVPHIACSRVHAKQHDKQTHDRQYLAFDASGAQPWERRIKGRTQIRCSGALQCNWLDDNAMHFATDCHSSTLSHCHENYYGTFFYLPNRI